MLDGLSLVASVITLVAGVVEVVKRARTFYRASEELGELLEQVEQFANVLSGIDDRKSTYPSNVITILGRAKTTLEQLKSLVETKIITKVNNSSRVRRRAWAKSRSKVYRIQSSLKEDRLNLVIALTADQSSSTARSEATLTSISQQVGCSTDPLISLRTQLSNIQESVSKTHDAVMVQTNTVNSVLQSMSVAPRSHLYATNELPLTQGALSSEEWYNEYTNQKTHLNNRASGNYAISRRSLSPTPMTPLEASRNFFAESYTVDAQVPRSCLVVIGSFEQLTRVDSKTNVYKLFYLNSSRRWQWLTISIQMPCSSRYWDATKTVQQDKVNKWGTPKMVSGAALLPYSLLKKIQAFLCQGEEFNDDARMHLFLTDQDTIKRRPQISHNDPLSTPSWPLSTPSNALTYLHDLGCGRYDESEVVQIKIVDPPHCFCSSLNGLLVYEIKFKDSIPTVEMLYAIRVLHCMNGSPGFTKLIGIVTDDSRRYLKSYLIELPRARWNMSQMAENPSVSWERREKWALQLVRGISRIHAHSFVVGGLNIWNIPLINNTDSVQFWLFKERFVTGRKVGVYYPPEFLHLWDMPPTVDDADSPCVTSKTDIFHLGLMLWLLAENKAYTPPIPVCRRMGCSRHGDKGKDDSNTCDLSHAEPIALSPLPESIPKYFRDTVDACRREDP
ncbi:hypothetical protein MMC22_005408, partial [Lobaria immixta]|nr:hypothetical protein [Lobaria immixta]